MIGLITKLITRMYYVDVEGSLYKCSTKGKLRKDSIKPLVGDKVKIELDPHTEDEAIISEVIKRKNDLKRPKIANVDNVVFVCSAKEPETNFELLDRLLLECERKNISALICINKIDLDKDAVLESEFKKRFNSTPYKLVCTSLLSPESIENLRKNLSKGVNVFAGASGVGKSTLINALSPSAAMETGVISQKLLRGKHTTRHSELLYLGENVYLCDTPGFSGYESDNIMPEEIQNFMPEIKKHSYECKFSDCIHIREPDCGVLFAIEKGLISNERYESYLSFVNEARENINRR